MKKIASILLILVLVISLFGACKKTAESTPVDKPEETSAEVNSGDPMAKYDPPITITAVVALGDDMQQMMGVKEDVLTDNNWFHGYANDLGINIEYLWSVPGSQYVQKMSTQIAANDLPDIFNVDSTQLKMLVDSGMVADMTSVFETYQTDFTREMFDADNGVSISQASQDGKLMAIPSVNGNVSTASMMWIRQDWLEHLGLEAPTTTEELAAVAKAFTEDDPDGNGEKDTYGIALNKEVIKGGLNDATGIFEAFGAYPGGWLQKEDGIVSGLVQPEIKEALGYMADLYNAGYMDKEFSAKDNAKASEDIVGGRVGITFGQHWAAFWPFQDAINANPDANWVPYAIPSKDGSLGKPMVHGSASGYTATNLNAANPEATIKMLNYYYAKDCALSPDYDTTFHVTSTLQMERPEESFLWAPVKSFYPRQNLFIQEGVKKYLDGDQAVLENAWVSDNAIQCEKYLEDPVANQQYWSAYRWSGPEGAYAVVSKYEKADTLVQNAYILSNTEGMTQYKSSLDQITLETFTKIIMGAESVDGFDNYVEQWSTLGGEEITAEINELMVK